MKKATIELYMRPQDQPLSSYYVHGGYHAFDTHGYSFVVHRKVYAGKGKWCVGDTWGVSETTCGAKVRGDGWPTRKAAIDAAWERLEDTPKEQLDAAISEKLIQIAKGILEA